MLDIRKIKENPEAVKAGLRAKEVDCDAVIDQILELDVQVRALKTSTETKTAEKNKMAKENGKLFGQKKGMESVARIPPPSTPRSMPTWPLPLPLTKPLLTTRQS